MYPGSESLPFVAPGVVLALVLGAVLSPVLAARLRVARVTAWLMLATFGSIVAATMSPLISDVPVDPGGPRTCDLSRVGLPTLEELLAPTDVTLNILLFVPLGFTVAMVPGRTHRAVLTLATVALPFAIEAIQLAVAPLGRACQAWDVTDNLTGIILGLVAGAVVVRLVPSIRRGSRGSPGA